jgi:hypothetical protein
VGSGVTKRVSKVRFYPRANWAGRMLNGKFQGSNSSDFSGAVDLFTITTTPASSAWTEGTVSNTNGFRYLRYLSPAGGWGNVAEVEFYGVNGTTTGGAPIGSIIALRAEITNQFVSTNLNTTNNPLQANYANSVGSWERYQVMDAGNGQIALRSQNNSKYVSVNLNSGSQLQAGSATSIGAWEKFTWTDAGNGKIGLLSGASGKYVSVNPNNSGLLEAGFANSIGSWERFTSSVQ